MRGKTIFLTRWGGKVLLSKEKTQHSDFRYRRQSNASVKKDKGEKKSKGSKRKLKQLFLVPAQ